MKDEYALVLDFLSHGYSGQRSETPTAQVIGEEHFNLLEVVLKENTTVNPYDRVYIGSEVRDVVKSIKRKLTIGDLTATSRSELESVLNIIVTKNEKKFVDFFNKAGPITVRQHQFELLPGIGKKHMWEIIEERKKKPFETFEDIKKRVTLLPDPKKAVIKRILTEIENPDETKWFLFATPPAKDPYETY